MAIVSRAVGIDISRIVSRPGRVVRFDTGVVMRAISVANVGMEMGGAVCA